MKIISRCLPYLLVLALASAAIAQIQLNPVPTRVVGQTSATQTSLNLVEGRELNSPQGIALDLNSNPPILYVADSGNHRVLGFKNANSFANGQKADLVIGQVDFQSTSPQGPGNGRRNSGLTVPTGLAVDAQSNLYVVDSGNNRILRFPKPAAHTDQLPDLVIGQLGFTINTANFNGITPQSLAFTNPNSAFAGYLAFDSTGNLWVADAGNNRVLRYPASSLGPDAKNGPAADLVLGQLDFATNTPNNDPANPSNISTPTGIAFDQQGRLYVAESQQGAVRARILIYNPPFVRNGQPASRILGVVPASVTPQPPAVSEQQFGAGPGGLFVINNGIGIADTQNNRLLAFKPTDQFTSNTLTQQAQIQYLFGQTDFSSRLSNLGLQEAGPDRLAAPAAVAVSPTELFIADSANNRVIVVPYSGSGLVSAATRVIGQDQLNLNSPNLVEGREFRFTSGVGPSEAGIVADLNSNPPHLYVADTFNNRVLGFRDLRNIKGGDRADIVIGQPDFAHTQINYPNDANNPTASSLFQPTGLALDAAGNLYVADSGNGRVLRFASPFAQPATLPVANLVLGQRNFTSKIQDASASTMGVPYGLAFASNNGLLVSDNGLNRVLYFSGTPASFTNGQAATTVFGQPDFNTSSAPGNSTADNRFNQPRGIATDGDDRLYVADTGNSRVVIFERAPSQTNDPRPSRILTGLSGARGVYVNPATLELWVAAAGTANALLRFPKFNDQPLNGFASNASIPDGGPLAVTQDAYGNLYTADSSNRVQINFPALSTFNAASFLSASNQALAPGSIATLFALFDKQFGTATATASGSPLPTQLAGVQVSLNGIPAPLYFVGPNQVNFVLPQSAPTNGTGDLLVSRVDTGQILGNYPIPLNISSPAIFALNPLTPGAGQAAALNQDGSVNGKDHPATNGSVISIFGTGEGVVPGAPPDGVAPTGALPTATKPQVIVGTKVVDDANVQYSGLAPGLVGVWQVNVKIPEDVAATELTGGTPLAFVINGIASTGPGRLTTIWVTGKR